MTKGNELARWISGWEVEAKQQGEALLTAARQNFGAFYATATAEDVEAMDGLVLVRPAWIATSEMPRNVSAPLAEEIERLTDKLDQAFASCREAVRRCPTFATLPTAERAKIEHDLFNFG